jgi:hypothetical protein
MTFFLGGVSFTKTKVDRIRYLEAHGLKQEKEHMPPVLDLSVAVALYGPVNLNVRPTKSDGVASFPPSCVPATQQGQGLHSPFSLPFQFFSVM